MQPDIEEEEEDELDNTEYEAAEQPGDACHEAIRDGTGQRTEDDDKEKRFVRLWVRVHISFVCKPVFLTTFHVLSICSCQRCASFAAVSHETFPSVWSRRLGS
jgi:hypothetical protein